MKNQNIDKQATQNQKPGTLNPSQGQGQQRGRDSQVGSRVPSSSTSDQGLGSSRSSDKSDR